MQVRSWVNVDASHWREDAAAQRALCWPLSFKCILTLKDEEVCSDPVEQFVAVHGGGGGGGGGGWTFSSKGCSRR